MKYFNKFLKLSATIWVPFPDNQTSEGNSYFSFSHYLNGFLEIKDRLIEELESEPFQISEDKELEYKKFICDKLQLNVENVPEMEESKISDWFNKYGLEYVDVYSILQLDRDTALHQALSFHENQGEFEYNDSIFLLQNDFLCFSKHEISKMIKEKALYHLDKDVVEGSKKDIHPFRDEKRFQQFLNYSESFVFNPYIDYSYLFQKLIEHNFIEKIAHKDFMNWLKSKEIIDDEKYHILYTEGFFRSLKKSFSRLREKNFQMVFED